jgi:hypothetical protein
MRCTYTASLRILIKKRSAGLESTETAAMFGVQATALQPSNQNTDKSKSERTDKQNEVGQVFVRGYHFPQALSISERPQSDAGGCVHDPPHEVPPRQWR